MGREFESSLAGLGLQRSALDLFRHEEGGLAGDGASRSWKLCTATGHLLPLWKHLRCQEPVGGDALRDDSRVADELIDQRTAGHRVAVDDGAAKVGYHCHQATVVLQDTLLALEPGVSRMESVHLPHNVVGVQLAQTIDLMTVLPRHRPVHQIAIDAMPGPSMAASNSLLTRTVANSPTRRE